MWILWLTHGRLFSLSTRTAHSGTASIIRALDELTTGVIHTCNNHLWAFHLLPHIPDFEVLEPDLRVTLLREEAESFIEGFHDFQDRINDRLQKLLRNDRFLEYIVPKSSSTSLTEQQVKDALALHHGQAIRLVLQRADGVQLPVVVRSDGRVGDIYKAVVDVTNDYVEQLRSSRLSEQIPKSSRCHHKNKKKKKCHKHRLQDSPKVNSVVSAFAYPPPLDSKKLNWKRFWRTRALGLVSTNSTNPLIDKKKPIKDQENLKNGVVLRFIQRGG
ncbi:unnamed protein product [Schistocephalus solidus]|uniref:Anoct_dimer domain-containing protein n=1 Tax=Schistocephalus solidus TaxID=70667 RepID=A0A183TF30_SCHSO|nr:unnamed protein product [Schistocephalus solidus]